MAILDFLCPPLAYLCLKVVTDRPIELNHKVCSTRSSYLQRSIRDSLLGLHSRNDATLSITKRANGILTTSTSARPR